ncbi:MAG TPA: hypothetical protein VEO54_20215 [Thermoanaerobaculia bacterium]|nr:hypothetical protein [Thermoanaerobaculia bacterium]
MRPIIRVLAVAAVTVALSTTASAAPRERGPKEKVPPIVKMLKSIVRTLGDGLTVPLP